MKVVIKSPVGLSAPVTTTKLVVVEVSNYIGHHAVKVNFGYGNPDNLLIFSNSFDITHKELTDMRLKLDLGDMVRPPYGIFDVVEIDGLHRIIVRIDRNELILTHPVPIWEHFLKMDFSDKKLIREWVSLFGKYISKPINSDYICIPKDVFDNMI